MDSEVFGRIGRYYDGLLSQHGHSARSCDYGHPNSQRAKFEVMSQVLDFTGRRVLDVGCGLADYATFLKGRFNNVTYVGVDISESMLSEAKKAHPDLDLRHLNILSDDPGRFDIVTANGIFYLLGEEASSLMRQLIERMYSFSNEAVAFTSLSRWAPDQEPQEYYADPLDTVAYCRTLAPWVALRHDYHPRDFSIYLYRSAHR